MKTSRKAILKIAKKLFNGSLTGGELDIKKLQKNIQITKTGSRKKALGILKAYSNLVNQHIKGETLVIEAADPLPPRNIEEVKTYFERRKDKELKVIFQKNPDLLGGLKVTLADNQWDFSVNGKINQMEEALLGRYR